MNPGSAVKVAVTSEEQTCRSDDNAFLPLRRRQLSAQRVTTPAYSGSAPSVRKNFGTVFAAPAPPLAQSLLGSPG